MKKIFSVSLILFSAILLSHCDEGLENPNYPIEPSITFKGIEFIEVPEVGTNDSLKFTISYRDGDSDLGLDFNDPDYLSDPYHQAYYFLEDGSGDTTKVNTKIFSVIHPPYGLTPFNLLNLPSSVIGKLVTPRTRLKPNYGFLPEYVLNNCIYYAREQFLVSEESGVIDDTYNVIDTIVDSNKRYFLIWDLLLYESNENFYNIFVEFYISDDGVNFTEFNWLRYCNNYNQRFPLLLDHTGTFKAGPFKIKAKTPWEGEITYSMPNPSFYTLFSTKKLKLKIKIKDRALHTSNVIETPVFTIDEIRKK